MKLRLYNFILLGLCVTVLLKGGHCTFDDSIVLMTDSHIRGLYGVSSETKTIYSIAVKRILNPIAIHYNEINERIYWSDVMLKEIRSTSVSGHDDVIIRTLDNSSIPDGLAVDPVSALIFYTDAGNQLIALMNLDGSNHVVIVDKDTDKPRAIVLDAINGKIYWSDWGIHPKIETANYDGSERKTIIESGLLWPNALTIDFAEKWMYWGDAGTHNIERSRLDGTDRKVIFYDAKAHYFSMLIYTNKLFYTDWQKKSVMAISVNGDDISVNVGNESFARLNDISRLKSKPNYPETNACSKSNGGCSHICIPRTKGKHACLCPTGFILKEGSLCIKDATKSVSRCEPLRTRGFATVTPNECLTQALPTGKVCNVACPEGFIYDGFKYDLECKDDGYWSDVVHDCIDVTRPIIHNCPKNMQILTTNRGVGTGTVTWEKTIVSDNSGIKPNVYSSMNSGISLQEGEYTVSIFAVDHAGNTAICVFTFFIIARRCGLVPVPDRGYVVSSQCPDYYGAKCKIACNTGYQLSTSTNVATIECVIDENNGTIWNPHQLSCIPITCLPIPSPNTELSGCTSPHEFGSVCEQTCRKGFERISGSMFRICKHDGSWSGEDLQCKEKPVECPKLSPLAEVTVLGCSPPYEVGSICEQTCDFGYVSDNRGSGIRLCKQDGTWSGTDIRCIKVTVGETSKTLPQLKDSGDGISMTYISILVAGFVLVFSGLLINFGIFVYIQKQSGNTGKPNIGQPNVMAEHGVEETNATPHMSELKSN